MIDRQLPIYTSAQLDERLTWLQAPGTDVGRDPLIRRRDDWFSDRSFLSGGPIIARVAITAAERNAFYSFRGPYESWILGSEASYRRLTAPQAAVLSLGSALMDRVLRLDNPDKSDLIGMAVLFPMAGLYESHDRTDGTTQFHADTVPHKSDRKADYRYTLALTPTLEEHGAGGTDMLEGPMSQQDFNGYGAVRHRTLERVVVGQLQIVPTPSLYVRRFIDVGTAHAAPQMIDDTPMPRPFFTADASYAI